jgi:bacteriocin-like protein
MEVALTGESKKPTDPRKDKSAVSKEDLAKAGRGGKVELTEDELRKISGGAINPKYK